MSNNLDYNAIAEDSKENFKNPRHQLNHEFESLYPSETQNMRSISPSLQAMESRRNNLKERIANANKAIKNTKTLGIKGSLPKISLLDASPDENSDEHYYENTISSNARRMFKRGNQSKESLQSGRSKEEDRAFSMKNIEDKYVTESEMEKINQNQTLQPSQRYKNKQNAIPEIATERSNSRPSLNAGMVNFRKKKSSKIMSRGQMRSRKDSNKIFSTEIKMFKDDQIQLTEKGNNVASIPDLQLKKLKSQKEVNIASFSESKRNPINKLSNKKKNHTQRENLKCDAPLSRRDHFSRLTIPTERSNSVSNTRGPYHGVSKEMLINELEIIKAKQKLSNLKREQLVLENQDLKRKNEYCLKEHSKLYEASRLIEKSDHLPDKEEIKKEIDNMLQKLQALEMENMELKLKLEKANQTQFQNISFQNKGEVSENILFSQFLLKLEMFRLNKVNQMLVHQLTDKQAVIDGLNKSIDNLKNDFQEKLIQSQKELNELSRSRGGNSTPQLQKKVLELQGQIQLLEEEKSDLLKEVDELSSKLAEKEHILQNSFERNPLMSTGRSHGRSILPSSLLLTLMRQIYQKVEKQALIVYSAIKGTPIANKLINIAPQVNYAITQGLSTLEYEHFIQINELVVKAIGYVTSLPFFQSSGNFESGDTEQFIRSQFGNDYFTPDIPQTNRTKPGTDRNVHETFHLPNLMLNLQSSTYDLENMRSINVHDKDNGSTQRTCSDGGERTLTTRTVHTKGTIQEEEKEHSTGNMNFDDGNIQIQDENLVIPVEKNSPISPKKASVNDSMIVSEIITADKIMDQNSHSNQKAVNGSSKFDTMNTSPFQNNFTDSQLEKIQKGMKQQKTQKKVYHSNSNASRQQDEENLHKSNTVSEKDHPKVNKQFNVPLMESMEMNLMATNLQSSTPSNQPNFNHISFNTHTGPVNDQLKLINENGEFHCTFQKATSKMNTAKSLKELNGNFETMQSSDPQIQTITSSQYNVKPVSFTVQTMQESQKMLRKSQEIAGEDPDTMHLEEEFQAREPEMENTDVFFAQPVEVQDENSTIFAETHTVEENNYGEGIQPQNEPGKVHQRQSSIQYKIQYSEQVNTTREGNNTNMITSRMINVNLNNKWQHEPSKTPKMNQKATVQHSIYQQNQISHPTQISTITHPTLPTGMKYLNPQTHPQPMNYSHLQIHQHIPQQGQQNGVNIQNVRMLQTPKGIHRAREATSSFTANSVSMPRDMKASSPINPFEKFFINNHGERDSMVNTMLTSTGTKTTHDASFQKSIAHTGKKSYLKLKKPPKKVRASQQIYAQAGYGEGDLHQPDLRNQQNGRLARQSSGKKSSSWKKRDKSKKKNRKVNS